MKPEKNKDFKKYIDISMQMMATIAISTWGGIKLDEYFALQHPWFLCSMALLSTILSVFILIKRLL